MHGTLTLKKTTRERQKSISPARLALLFRVFRQLKRFLIRAFLRQTGPDQSLTSLVSVAHSCIYDSMLLPF
jgi:hypothetical protein